MLPTSAAVIGAAEASVSDAKTISVQQCAGDHSGVGIASLDRNCPQVTAIPTRWPFKFCTIGEEEVRYLSLAATGNDWFGPHFISFGCEVPESATYEVYIEALKGPAQAQVQLFQNENSVAPAVDLYAETPVKSGRLLVGQMPMSEGRNNVMLKLVGKNERSSGLGLDLIEIICRRTNY